MIVDLQLFYMLQGHFANKNKQYNNIEYQLCLSQSLVEYYFDTLFSSVLCNHRRGSCFDTAFSLFTTHSFLSDDARLDFSTMNCNFFDRLCYARLDFEGTCLSLLRHVYHYVCMWWQIDPSGFYKTDPCRIHAGICCGDWCL